MVLASNLSIHSFAIAYNNRHNKYLYGAMLASFILTTAVIFIPPLANAFQFESISTLEYLVAMGLGILVIPIVEIIKFLQRTFDKTAE